jgi:membrane protein required for colicin V production
MELYDLIMLAVLALATLLGAWKGLAWQVASLSSIFASFFIASQFRGPVAAAIRARPPWNMFLAMLILYLGSALLIWIAFRFVSELIDRVRLKEFDRHAGAVMGFARGVLWCAIITLFAVTLLGETQQRAIIGSRSGYYLALLLDRAHTVMPDELHEVLAPYIHSLDERLPPDQRVSNRHDGGSQDGLPESGLLPQWPGEASGGDSDDAIQRWLQKLPETPFGSR